MAASIGALTSLGNTLQTAYKNIFAKQFSDETFSMKIFDQLVAEKDFKWDGRSLRFATNLRRSRNYGMRGPGATLPDEIKNIGTGGTAATERTEGIYEQAEVIPSRAYVRLALDGDVEAAARSDVKAFVNVLVEKKKAARAGLAKYMEQQLPGDGSCTLSEVASVAGAVVTVRTPVAATPGQWGLYWLGIGAYICFINPVTGLVRGTQGHRITAIDPVNATFTVTPDPVGVAAGDRVVEGETRANSWNEGILGLTAALGTAADLTTYLGISRDTYERWEGTQAAAAAVGALGDFTPFLPRLAVRQARSRGGLEAGKPGFTMLVPSGIWDEAAYGPLTGQGAAGGNDINANRRYNSSKGLVAGVSSYDFEDPTMGMLTVYDCPDLPNNFVWLLRNGTFKWFMMKDFEWVPGYAVDGTFTVDADADRFLARGRMYLQLGCTHPGSSARIQRVRQRADGLHSML